MNNTEQQEQQVNDIAKELESITKHYGLSELMSADLIVKAYDWLSARTIWKTLRTSLRFFILEYYRDNHLIDDNPTLGNGLGRWHIQIVDDPNHNIYCGQKMAWDSSFHRNLTVKKIHEESRKTNGVYFQFYDVCGKCVVGYLTKYRKLKN